MEYLVYTRRPKLLYYGGFDGSKPCHVSKGDAPRLSLSLADKVIEQLTTLGFKGYKKCSSVGVNRETAHETTS